MAVLLRALERTV